jgi:hypothetical protein
LAIHGSIYPGDFYQQRAVKARAGYCFVLMPFAPELKPVFETICAVIETDRGILCADVRMTSSPGGTFLRISCKGSGRQKL